MAYKLYNTASDIIISKDVLEYPIVDYLPSLIVTACHNQFKDYKFTRSRLKEAALSWETLSNKDKTIICQHRATNEDTCKSILGSEYIYWSTHFGVESKKCRDYRIEYAKSILIENIELSQRYQILGVIGASNLDTLYINHGLEGTNDNDALSGLFDYIEGTGDFTGSGIKDMSLTMIGSITKAEMITQIMDCLRNGEY